MVRLLRRASVRFLLRHPWQTWLTFAGITLGVAVPVAVDIANSSAKRSMELSMTMISGPATHQIVGGVNGIDEDVYSRIRTELGIVSAQPRVNGVVSIDGTDYQLLGIDPLARFSDRTQSPQKAVAAEDASALMLAPALMARPNTLAMSTQTARALALASGDSLTIRHGGQPHAMTVAAILPGLSLDGQSFLLCDLSVAQEVLNKIGRLDSIDLVMEDQASLERLALWLPPALTLVEIDNQLGDNLQLTEAFYINLTAMSLLALLMGAFLIYNTMTFSILRRRKMLATLRALGVSSRELFTLLLSEALLLGSLATLAGIFSAIALAQSLLHLVTRTIDDLFYNVQVTELTLGYWSIGKAVLLGLGLSCFAALLPAWRASRDEAAVGQQRSALEANYRAHYGPRLVLAVSLIALGLVLGRVPNLGLVSGFVSLALIVLGFSLLAPFAVLLMSDLCLKVLSAGGPVVRLAARGIAANLSRTGMAATALSIAVATLMGVSIMIDSFRYTLQDWLEQSFNGDLYISQPTRVKGTAQDGSLESLLVRLQQYPGVAQLWTSTVSRTQSEFGQLRLFAIGATAEHGRGFTLKRGDEQSVRQAFSANEGILISEPLANKERLEPGEYLELHTAQGPIAFPVLGVFYDYTTGPGLVVMPQQLYRQLWQDESIGAIGLFKQDRVSVAEFEAEIAELAKPFQVRISSNRQIKQVSLAIFDRTFAITQVLRLLTLVVAFIGVFCALMSLLLERRAEFALLRATGMTGKETAGLILLQTALMGTFAGILALPLGLLMADSLINVINPRAFGWSMQQIVTPSALWQGFALSIIAALLAGLLPARDAVSMPIAEALRQE